MGIEEEIRSEDGRDEDDWEGKRIGREDRLEEENRRI
jgi:hypothetical protein